MSDIDPIEVKETELTRALQGFVDVCQIYTNEEIRIQVPMSVFTRLYFDGMDRNKEPIPSSIEIEMNSLGRAVITPIIKSPTPLEACKFFLENLPKHGERDWEWRFEAIRQKIEQAVAGAKGGNS